MSSFFSSNPVLASARLALGGLLALVLASPDQAAASSCGSCGEGPTVKVAFAAAANRIHDPDGKVSMTLKGVTVVSAGVLSPDADGNGPAITSNDKVDLPTEVRQTGNQATPAEQVVEVVVNPGGGPDNWDGESQSQGGAVVCVFQLQDACGWELEIFANWPNSSGPEWRAASSVVLNYQIVVAADQQSMVQQTRTCKVRLKRAGSYGSTDPKEDERDAGETGTTRPPGIAPGSMSPPGPGGSTQPESTEPATFESAVSLRASADAIQGSGEGTAGSLNLQGTISPLLADVAKLRAYKAYGTDDDDYVLVIHANGDIRQVRTAGHLTDVKPIQGGGFEVRKYEEGQFDPDRSPSADHFTPFTVYYDTNPSAANEAPNIVRYTPVAAAGGHFGGIRVTTVSAKGVTRVRDVVSTSAAGDSWNVIHGGLETVEHSTSYGIDTGIQGYPDGIRTRHDVVSVYRDGVLYSRRTEVYAYLPRWWQDPPPPDESRAPAEEHLLEERIATNGNSENDLITRYQPLAHGHQFNPLGPLDWRLHYVSRPDGSWVAYRYGYASENEYFRQLFGYQTSHVFRPFNGQPALPTIASPDNTHCTTHNNFVMPDDEGGFKVAKWYKVTLPGDIPGEGSSEPADSDAVPATLFDLLEANGLDPEWRDDQDDLVKDLSTRVLASDNETITDSRLQLLDGRSFASLDPDGNGTVTGYERGSFVAASGAFTPDENPSQSSGDYVRSITLAVAGFDAIPVPGEATKTIGIRDLSGRPYRSELWILQAPGSWSLATATTYEYPDSWPDGSPRGIIEKRDGRIVSHTYHASALETVAWDEEGIKTTTVRDLLGRPVSITRQGLTELDPAITTTYAYAGRQVAETTAAGTLSRTRVTVEDLAGRVKSETSPSGAVTTTAYPDMGMQTLTTYPGGGAGPTRHVQRDIEGRTVSVTGTAVVDEHFSYGVIAATGHATVTRRVGDLADSPRYTIVETDLAGRTVKETRPSPTGTGTVDIVTSYAPGTRRMVSRSSPAGTALLRRPSPASSLIRTGDDTNASGNLEPASTDRLSESLTRYVHDGTYWWEETTRKTYDVNGSDASAVTSVSKRCLHGNPNGLASWTVTVSPSGATETVQVAIDRAAKELTETVVRSGVSAPAVAEYVNGLLVSQKGHDATVAATFEYDALGQLVREVSSRGTITRRSYLDDGLLATVTDHTGAVTRYAYHPANHPAAGRLASVTDPLGKTVTYAYSSRGEVVEEAGTAAYKVTYAYDAYGAKWKMWTWRDATTSDLTEWIYQPGTGLLQAKKDAAGEGAAYTYRTDGKLATRTWARGTVTEYDYNAHGDLIEIDYSDATPDVTLTGHDRLGRATSVTQAGLGAETLTYHAGSGSLNARYYASGHALLPGLGVRYPVPDAAGRPAGFSETSAENATVIHTVGYGYDPATGLLAGVTAGGESHDYAYHANSALISTIHSKTGTTAWFRQTRYYDIPGRLTGIRSDRMNGASVVAAISTHAYNHDALGRRTRQTFQDGSAWEYGYNDRSEVVSAVRKNPAGTAIAPLGASYAYDGIGNRTASTSAVLGDHGYTPNELNQYAAITTGTGRTAIGRAPAAATIQVNGQAATEDGELYYRALTADNGDGPVWQEVVTAATPGASVTRHFWYGAATFAPEHDEDGNLLDDGRWSYSWDAENRLIQMETTNQAVNAGHPYVKLAFAYDWQSRRLARHVWQGGTQASPVFKSATRWLYDAWNPVTEFTAPSATSTALVRDKVYTWGLDLSGTLQGAGGVGGLLAVLEPGTGAKHAPSYDGNGNIVAWTRSDQSAPTTRREYDAFGNALVSEGAAPCGFGFSTKLQDAETGLYYYGYRYYDPVTGRWPSRDPIEENGGFNLNAFVSNNGANGLDVLGLLKEDDRPGFAPGQSPNSLRELPVLNDCEILILVGHGFLDLERAAVSVVLESLRKHEESKSKDKLCAGVGVAGCISGKACRDAKERVGAAGSGILFDLGLGDRNMNNDWHPDDKDESGKANNAAEMLNAARDAAKKQAKELCGCKCKCEKITIKVQLYGEHWYGKMVAVGNEFRFKKYHEGFPPEIGQWNDGDHNFIRNFADSHHWRPYFEDFEVPCESTEESDGY